MFRIIKDFFVLMAGFFTMLSHLLKMMISGLEGINNELGEVGKEMEQKRLKDERERILKQIAGSASVSRVSNTEDKS